VTDHDQFETDVVRHLRDSGWVVPVSMTYHEILDAWHVRGVAARNDPTSMSVRGQADRLAFVDDAELSCRVEIKTVGTRHRNLAVQLFPLCEHLLRSRMGCECVYAVRHLGDGREYGFRVDAGLVDTIAAAFVPARWSDQQMAQLIDWTSDAFPGVQFVRKPDPLRGSGTPYVLIPDDELAFFDDWRGVFSRLQNTAKGLPNAKDSHDKTGILD